MQRRMERLKQSFLTDTFFPTDEKKNTWQECFMFSVTACHSCGFRLNDILCHISVFFRHINRKEAVSPPWSSLDPIFYGQNTLLHAKTQYMSLLGPIKPDNSKIIELC